MNTTDKLLKFYNLKALHSKFSLFIAVNWSMVDFILELGVAFIYVWTMRALEWD